ncbi:HdeD family acid-resistance protein [Candidatus Microgenomates bacterium]|nr:HdeD family acid-resistance protein [Candidatus Microgenomates bacterium]
MLQRASWTVGLRGLAAVLFGVVLFAWPDITLELLIKVFAIYAFVEGLVVALGSLRYRHEVSDWPTLMLLGVFSALVGIFMFAKPELTELAFLYLIAARALVVGVLDIGVGVQVRREVKDEWLVFLSGLASVLFGVIVFARPAESAVALVWLISLYAVVHGLFMMAFAMRAKGLAGEVRRVEE